MKVFNYIPEEHLSPVGVLAADSAWLSPTDIATFVHLAAGIDKEDAAAFARHFDKEHRKAKKDKFLSGFVCKGEDGRPGGIYQLGCVEDGTHTLFNSYTAMVISERDTSDPKDAEAAAQMYANFAKCFTKGELGMKVMWTAEEPAQDDNDNKA